MSKSRRDLFRATTTGEAHWRTLCADKREIATVGKMGQVLFLSLLRYLDLRFEMALVTSLGSFEKIWPTLHWLYSDVTHRTHHLVQ